MAEERHEDRLCLYCGHFRLDFGDWHYSEYTPGGPGEAECVKGVWCMDPDDAATDFAKHMLTGETCAMFVLSDAARQVRRVVERFGEATDAE